MANIAINNLFTRCESQLIEPWQNKIASGGGGDYSVLFVVSNIIWPYDLEGVQTDPLKDRPNNVVTGNWHSINRQLQYWTTGNCTSQNERLHVHNNIAYDPTLDPRQSFVIICDNFIWWSNIKGLYDI